MKRLLVSTALIFVLSFGLAQAQSVGSVAIENPSGLVPGSTTELKLGLPSYTFDVRFTNTSTTCVFNNTNGFRVYSPDGATWNSTDGAWNNALDWAQNFINLFSEDGMGSDTVGFGGVAFDPTSEGIQPGFDGVIGTITLGGTDQADSGLTICIDSSFYRPSNGWKWAELTSTGCGQIAPDWGGPYCWTLVTPPDLPAEFTNCPTDIVFSHCEVGTYDFDAVDSDATGQDGCAGEGPADAIEYELVSGPGSIDPATGVWTWSGPSVPQSGFDVIEVVAHTICGGIIATTSDPCVVNIEVTNAAPTFTGGCNSTTTVQTGNTTCVAMAADDDCDPLTYAVLNAGDYTGLVEAVGNEICFTPDPADVGDGQEVVVEVSDGELTDTCSIFFNVIDQAPYQVEIEKIHDQIQGQFAEVDIILNSIFPEEGLGGFDILIAYDASALSFQQALEGDIYAECGWEYFTYRYGADGNCGGGCPTGVLRVVGTAETNNAFVNNNCQNTPYVNGLPTTLAKLVFLVSNDRTLECQYVPVRFWWLDCGDNTLSNFDGSKLFISAKVFEYGQESPFNAGDVGFPTFQGAQDVCLDGDKTAPERQIDFQNGGVDIVCADSIDARGDINVNGIEYEVADAVMFTNYFISGLAAFNDHIDASIAASDANADGIPLSVADLVYLIRVVVGDAQPYPKATVNTFDAVAADYTVDNGVLSVSGSEIAAVALTVNGNVTPDLLVDNSELTYRFDGQNTRIIVTPSLEAASVEGFTGDVLTGINGEVLNIEMATVAGSPVTGNNVPANFALHQNYPNPFNPTTVVSFDLPKASEWTVTFYNVTGQVVDVVSGTNEAGTVEFDWNASDKASGIYFYRLEADGFSKTMKAVLLK